MAVPKYDEFFPYILEVLEKGNLINVNDIRYKVSKMMELSKEDMEQMLPSGSQLVFVNRCQWALTYLKKALLIESPSRGKYRITQSGKDYIEKNGFSITLKDLKNIEIFRQFLNPNDGSEFKTDKGIRTAESKKELEDLTPEEKIIQAFDELNQQLSDRLLEEIMNLSPKFFERLVLDLLYKMGYGGKKENAIIPTPYSQDDGIDGWIKEDELGLDNVYVQAKRWNTNSVGQPEIQRFSGALSGVGAQKGVFITTSTFSEKAIQYARSHTLSKIVLVDGKKLTELMIAYGVGVSVEYEYKLQKIDSDYFNEDGFS